jgi:hypothetical protein
MFLIYKYFVRHCPLYGVGLTYTTFWKMDSFPLPDVRRERDVLVII